MYGATVWYHLVDQKSHSTGVAAVIQSRPQRAGGDSGTVRYPGTFNWTYFIFYIEVMIRAMWHCN